MCGLWNLLVLLILQIVLFMSFAKFVAITVFRSNRFFSDVFTIFIRAKASRQTLLRWNCWTRTRISRISWTALNSPISAIHCAKWNKNTRAPMFWCQKFKDSHWTFADKCRMRFDATRLVDLYTLGSCTKRCPGYIFLVNFKRPILFTFWNPVNVGFIVQRSSSLSWAIWRWSLMLASNKNRTTKKCNEKRYNEKQRHVDGNH